VPNVQDFARFAPYSFDQLVKAANGILRNRPRLIVNPRTVRYYIAEGVLPAPIGSTRNARYEAEHLARLVGIRLLQDQGLSLTESNVFLTEWAADGINRLIAEVDRLTEREPTLDSRYEILSGLKLDEDTDQGAAPILRRRKRITVRRPPSGKLSDMPLELDSEPVDVSDLGFVEETDMNIDANIGERYYHVVPGVELKITDPSFSETDVLRIVKHLKLLIFRLSRY